MAKLKLALMVVFLVAVGGIVLRVWSNGQRPPINKVQALYEDDLMKLKGVVGVGIGGSERAPKLVIFVVDKKAQKYIDDLLADYILGYPVSVTVSGPIKALRAPTTKTKKNHE